MGPSRKRGNRPETISQIRFIEDTNSHLNTATASGTTIDKALENARTVSRQLTAIHAGELVVEPPLSHDQFVGFRDRAEVVISIGEKATAALEEAATSREASAMPGDSAKTSFHGAGASSKS